MTLRSRMFCVGVAALLLWLAVAPSASPSLATFAARTDNDANLVGNGSLSAPTLHSAALRPDGSTVVLTWERSASAFATGYRVYRGPSSTGPFTSIAQIADVATQTSSDVPGPGTFYYTVRAYYGGSWESLNNPVVGPIRPLDHFSIAPIGPQHSGVGFGIAVSARASDGSLVTAFGGSVNYAADGGSVTPATSPPFSAGTSSQTITISSAYASALRVTVLGGALARGGASAPFTLEHFRALNIELRNRTGGTAGLAENGDSIVITFSEAADPSTFGNCPAHDSGSDLVVGHGTGSDTLRAEGAALTFGTIDLGSASYFTASGVATASSCRWNGSVTVLTVTLAAVANAAPVATSTITYVPAASLGSAAGEPIDTTQRPRVTGEQF